MEKPVMIRWKSGKKVDPRLLTMLEYFRELYEKRQEFFKKIFPGHHYDFVDVFKKLGEVASTKKDHVKVETMQRSLSLGSPRSTELRLDRFRVRTPAVAVVRLGGQGGAGK